MSDPSKLSDDEIERLIERYRDCLDDIDWAEADPGFQFEGAENWRRHLAGKIRRLEGERDRRREQGRLEQDD